MKKQSIFLVLITLFICSRAISQINLNNEQCAPLNPENFNCARKYSDGACLDFEKQNTRISTVRVH